ncbi:MAG: type II toxin-antitoxin system VapC family toxin [Magnetococcales bacterium]|nr:type II toxin-antitoxin system VapC family toxin [Magnetococcales bacterium]MBF0116586.1 type II toxin-antitoxin system VapC family toxin [Magnetococcales bacterium]
MENYLLDTNVCIGLLKRHSAILARIQAVGWERLILCAPVKAELWYGAFKSDRPQANLAVLRDLFNTLPSLPFDDRAAQYYGEIRADLARSGTPIGPNDLLIAAVASAHGMTLVTNNTREFSRISGLQIEDWQQSYVQN